MKIDRISPIGIVCIIEQVDGSNHRRTLSPGSDISNEPQAVKDVCNEAWTPEVVEAYEAHKAAQI